MAPFAIMPRMMLDLEPSRASIVGLAGAGLAFLAAGLMALLSGLPFFAPFLALGAFFFWLPSSRWPASV